MDFDETHVKILVLVTTFEGEIIAWNRSTKNSMRTPWTHWTPTELHEPKMNSTWIPIVFQEKIVWTPTELHEPKLNSTGWSTVNSIQYFPLAWNIQKKEHEKISIP